MYAFPVLILYKLKRLGPVSVHFRLHQITANQEVSLNITTTQSTSSNTRALRSLMSDIVTFLSAILIAATSANA